MKKRWLSLLLAAALLVGLVPGLFMPAAATDAEKQLYGFYVNTHDSGFLVTNHMVTRLDEHLDNGCPMYFTTDANA